MFKFFKEIVIAFVAIAVVAAGFSFITQATADPFAHGRDDVVTITNGPGGEIWSHYETYAQLRNDGKKLRIDGVCASACTFFLGLLPPERVCATKYAHLGFHSIQMAMFGAVPEYSKAFFPFVYPQWLLDEFKTRGWDWEVEDVPSELAKMRLLWMTPEELNIQEC